MEKIEVNLLDLGNKARSKWEMYRLLTVDAHLYLPPYKLCTIDFIADIFEGKKKALTSDKVTIRVLPHVAGLRTHDILAFFVHNCGGENYLPNKFDDKVLDRSWLINICNSLYSEEFEDFIERKLSTCQSKIIKFNRLSIKTSPELANLLSNSKMVSTRKGRSHLLLNKNGKFERMAKQEAEKEEKEELKSQISFLKEEVKSLKEELLANEYERYEAEKNRNLLGLLYDQNIIDKEGKPI